MNASILGQPAAGPCSTSAHARAAPRVLFSGVVLDQPHGGVRRHAAELLPRLGHLLREAGGALEVMQGAGGLPFELPSAVVVHPSSVPAGGPLRRWRSESHALAALVVRAARRGRPFDWVHAGHLPAPRVEGPKASLVVHDLRRLEPALTGPAARLLGRALLRRALTRARLVLTVSETTRQGLLERFDVDPERVRVAPNAADHFTALPRRRAPDARLLHLGHVEPRKNLGLLIRALAADAGLPDLELVGRAKGATAARLAALARRLGVASRVHFLGPVADDELPERYSRAACLVLPSRLEGFGIPALEAQRCGLPVAIASAGALPEVAGPEAPRFGPDDPKACALAIRAAMEAPDAVLERARVRADAFRWDDAARRWFESWCSVS